MEVLVPTLKSSTRRVYYYVRVRTVFNQLDTKRISIHHSVCLHVLCPWRLFHRRSAVVRNRRTFTPSVVRGRGGNPIALPPSMMTSQRLTNDCTNKQQRIAPLLKGGFYVRHRDLPDQQQQTVVPTDHDDVGNYS